MMESNVISDESNDAADLRSMKDQLTEFGLYEENLSKEEMVDLLKALNNSKTSVKEEEIMRQQVDSIKTVPSPKALKRRYVNVKDRRMPWSLMPTNLTQAEKARVLAAYIKVMTINNHRQARKLINYAPWPASLDIPQESQETGTRIPSLRSTRSGRSVPVYADLDDDSSDADFIVSKPKKRKTSADTVDGTYSNKVISLKRKPIKDENVRPMKEIKINSDMLLEVSDTCASKSASKTRKDLFAMIED